MQYRTAASLPFSDQSLSVCRDVRTAAFVPLSFSDPVPLQSFLCSALEQLTLTRGTLLGDRLHADKEIRADLGCEISSSSSICAALWINRDSARALASLSGRTKQSAKWIPALSERLAKLLLGLSDRIKLVYDVPAILTMFT